MKKFRLIITAIVATVTFITVYSKNQQQNSLSDLQKENIEAISEKEGIELKPCYSQETGSIVPGENPITVCKEGTICTTLPWEKSVYNGTTAYRCIKESFACHLLYRRGHCYENVK